MSSTTLTVVRRTSTASFRDTAPAFKFYYTKSGKVLNEKTGAVQDAMIDAGSSVVLIPDQDMLNFGQKKLIRAMIDKFKNVNGGMLPTFRFEILAQEDAA